MFKYLLHSSLANYDAATKKWTFDLDRRISNPTALRLAKAAYSTPGDTSPHPMVVYLRSDALARMIPQKHTLELRALNHENAANVIAVLSETHTRGRYRILGGRQFPIDPAASERQIDIFFTDGDTLLDGAYGSGGGTATGSDAEIAALGELLLAWFDFAPARTLDAAYGEATDVGDEVANIYNRSPGPATLVYVNQYGNPLQLAAVGSAKGITRDGSWQSFADTSTPTGDLEETFCIHSLWVTPSTSGAHSYLFDVMMLKIFTWDGNTIGYKDDGGSNAVLGFSLVPGRAYILTCERRDATQDYNGNGNIEGYEFHFRLEDLVTDVVTTDTVVQGNDHPGSEQVWRLGKASTHFFHVQGPFIIHNGNDAENMATCQSWLRNKFNGTATAEESENGVAEGASFFVELDVAVK